MSDFAATSAPTARIPAGTQLNGIYEIERPIAAGGMGEVYKGRAIQTGDAVAIKMMLPDLAENDSALALFRKEASALHNLYHEAIVRYYVFTVEPVLQCPYLAMEFVEGESLSDLLQHGPLEFDAARLLMQRVAGGLEAAHQRGIIHRDVSPDNIIIPGNDVGKAKIIDFGIARSTTLGGEGTVIGGGFAGKYNYVSPEQLGMFGGDVTGKSDIYSLGLVMYGVLTGRELDMGGSQVEVIDKRRKVPDLSSVDARFRPLLEKMLQPDPADRPDSMAAVAEWPLQATAPPRRKAKATTVPGLARDGDGAPRRGWLKYAVAALLVALLAAGGGYVYIARPHDAARLWAMLFGPREVVGPGPAKKDEAAPPLGRVAQIERFINQYNGGDCFFLVPLEVRENIARIEGYGAALEPFRAFDAAFKKANNFEAEIGVLQVTQPECPAVAFLGRLRGATDDPPYLRVGGLELHDNQPLRGAVGSLTQKNIELVLVTEDGKVENVSRYMVSDCSRGCAIDGASFEISIPMQLKPGGEGEPKLLIAVSSTEPLSTLKTDAPVAASTFFPRVLVEAAQRTQGFAAATKYFKLVK
jgi:serine/threonine-protein kinase